MKINLEANERLEDLQCNGLKIIQSKDYYTFTSDSVILANFIDLKKDNKCVEIGTGCGVISILLSAKTVFEKIYAFEIQSNLAKIAEKNVILNNLQEKISIVCDDVRNFKQYFNNENFDVVFSNPPYMKENGSKNINQSRDLARHESMLPIDDLCKTAYGLLKYGGKFYVVYLAERSTELIYKLMENHLEPKRMFFTENGKGKVVLVVIEAVKGGRHGVTVLKNLVTNDRDGLYLKELQTKYVGKKN